MTFRSHDEPEKDRALLVQYRTAYGPCAAIRMEEGDRCGHISALRPHCYIDGTSGHRFPVNLEVGTFGVNSPIDISPGRGGFAAPRRTGTCPIRNRPTFGGGTFKSRRSQGIIYQIDVCYKCE